MPTSEPFGSIFEGGTMLGRGSAELLDRFAAQRDEAAFAALVNRHGPMVLATCRRILPDHADADDAFQATFLILARKARSIGDPNRLAPWLHGVARRVAGKARANRGRRQANLSRQGDDDLAAVAIIPPPADAFEVRAVIDEELARLPPKYRQALVLCYLEGLTHDEAANQLDCPVGTIRSRLAGGRDRLRTRLTRRGFAPGALALLSPATTPVSAVSRLLQAATVRLVFTSGAGKLAGPAALLAQGVLTSMFLAKVQTVAALAATTFAVATVGVVAAQSQGQVEVKPAAISTPPTSPTAAIDQAGATSTDRAKDLDAVIQRVKALETEISAIQKRESPVPPVLSTSTNLARLRPPISATIRLADGFDGKLGLNWKEVRSDPSHVSLVKNPGHLTITTQRGSINGDSRQGKQSGGILAKNLYLIDNPLGSDGDFTLTTRVTGFLPSMLFQQAGLIIYDNDDHYVKFVYEYSRNHSDKQSFTCVTETDAKGTYHFVANSESGLTDYWLRLTRHGANYEYASSLDGKTFRSHGVATWTGSPVRVGLVAKNGGPETASEIDAAFDFFEFTSGPALEVAQGADVYVAADSPIYQAIDARCQSLGFQTRTSFNTDYDTYLTKAQGKILIITCVGERMVPPADLYGGYLPLPMAEIQRRIQSNEPGVAQKRLDDGTRVILLYARETAGLLKLASTLELKLDDPELNK